MNQSGVLSHQGGPPDAIRKARNLIFVARSRAWAVRRSGGGSHAVRHLVRERLDGGASGRPVGRRRRGGRLPGDRRPDRPISQSGVPAGSISRFEHRAGVGGSARAVDSGDERSGEPAPSSRCAEPGAAIEPVRRLFLPYQWNIFITKTNLAWAVTLGSPAVKVAVLDTGICAHHIDTAGKVDAAQSASFVPPAFDCAR